MDFVKHTPWLVPLVLFGAMMSVPLVREPAQVQMGTQSEDGRAGSGGRQAKSESPTATPLGREDNQQNSSRNKESPAKEPKGDDDGSVKWTDVWIVRLTAALALLAAAQFVAAGLQARWTRKAVAAAKESADATRLAAEALTSAERAHLFVRVVAQNVQSMIVHGSMVPRERDGGHLEPRLQVTYVVKNYGKTPAVLKQFHHWLEPMAELPVVPVYGEPRGVPYQQILAEGEESAQIICTCEGWTTVLEAREIAEGRATVWFAGRVVYEDVVTGRERSEPFLYGYAGAGFNQDYREAYNKRT